VTHPHIEQTVAIGVGAILDTFKQSTVAACANLRVSEFAGKPILDRTAQLRRHGLHSVADAEHRDSRRPYACRCPRRFTVDDAVRASRKNDPRRRELADERLRYVERMDFTIHVQLAHAAGDELSVLRAEIENQDG
jgi:hypothetical protein